MRLYQKRKSNGTRVWWAAWTEGGVTIKRSTRCSTKGAAELVVERWERQRADPAYAAAYEATLGSQAGEFLKDCERRVRRRLKLGRVKGSLSESSLDMYKQKVGLLLNLIGGDTPLAEIDASKFAVYVKAREAHGAQESTIYKEWIALRGILKLARHHGRYHLVVADVKPLHFSGASKPRERVLTWDEIDRLLAELKPTRAAVVRFSLATGARLAECQHAEAGDIANGFVHLRGTKTKKSERVVPISPTFAPLLAGIEPPFAPWGKSHQDLAAACRRASVCWHHRTTPTGKRGPQFARRPVKGCADCEAMTMAPVTWNDFRRTFSSLLAEDGATPTVRAELLGHASTAMVDRHYTRIGPEALKQMLESQIQIRLLGPGSTNVRRDPTVTQTGATLMKSVDAVEDVTPETYGENADDVVGQDRLELSANGLRGPSHTKGLQGDSAGVVETGDGNIPPVSQAEGAEEPPSTTCIVDLPCFGPDARGES